jgi:hypothetical protein
VRHSPPSLTRCPQAPLLAINAASASTAMPILPLPIVTDPILDLIAINQ